MDLRKILYIVTILAGFADAYFSYLCFKSMILSEAIRIELNPLVDLLLLITKNLFIAILIPLILTIVLATAIYKLTYKDPTLYLPLQVIYAYIRITAALTPFTYLYFKDIFYIISNIFYKTYFVLIALYIVYILVLAITRKEKHL